MGHDVPQDVSLWLNALQMHPQLYFAQQLEEVVLDVFEFLGHLAIVQHLVQQYLLQPHSEVLDVLVGCGERLIELLQEC